MPLNCNQLAGPPTPLGRVTCCTCVYMCWNVLAGDTAVYEFETLHARAIQAHADSAWHGREAAAAPPTDEKVLFKAAHMRFWV